MTFTHAVSTNDYGAAKFIVDASAANGTHTTIASALTAASSGDTIFIRPGTYTENITLVAGVNLTAYPCDGIARGSATTNVIILGNTTASYNGAVTISGIQLKTNGAACITTSGANSSTLNLVNCTVNGNDATAIAMNAANFIVSLFYCSCVTVSNNLLFAVTTGFLIFKWCTISAGSGANTIAAGSCQFYFCNCGVFQVTTATSGSIIAYHSNFLNGNQTVFTLAGTGTLTQHLCNMSSGSSSAISIGTGCTGEVHLSVIQSSNTNVITGAGTLTYAGVVFNGSSTAVNVTTKTGVGLPVTNGTAGQFLKANGAGTIPTFQT